MHVRTCLLIMPCSDDICKTLAGLQSSAVQTFDVKLRAGTLVPLQLFDNSESCCSAEVLRVEHTALMEQIGQIAYSSPLRPRPWSLLCSFVGVLLELLLLRSQDEIRGKAST